MTLNDALNAIIDDGTEAVRLDYAKPQQTKREGPIAGFEECRGKSPGRIVSLSDLDSQQMPEGRAVQRSL